MKKHFKQLLMQREESISVRVMKKNSLNFLMNSIFLQKKILLFLKLPSIVERIKKFGIFDFLFFSSFFFIFLGFT
jgi:hypothetical protein